jgi:predicted Zn-dependent protease
MRKKVALLFCLVIAASSQSMAGCAPDFGADHSGPGRRAQRLALSPAEELELGRRAYAQVLGEFRGRILPADDPRTRQVRYVMSKLIRAVGIEPLQREINLKLRGYTFAWAANVVESDQVNAFCLPGGKMVVFTGILAVTQNDDQVAAVLGHEMAHALAHHANERVARDASGRVSFLRGKAYDRAQESEADHIGLFLMTFAGFDPREALRFWQTMEQRVQGGQLPEFLSDHPSGAHRIRDFETWVPQVLAAKKAFDEGRIAPAERR